MARLTSRRAYVGELVGVIGRVELIRDEVVQVQDTSPLGLKQDNDRRNLLASPRLGASACNDLGEL